MSRTTPCLAVFLPVLVAVAALAAPVPQVPEPDLRAFASRAEFDTATIDRAAKVLGSVDRRQGIHTETNKGWYATYFTEDGVMVLSNIPDGRLAFGYFSHETGLPIEYNREPAPKACIGCHNKAKEK